MDFIAPTPTVFSVVGADRPGSAQFSPLRPDAPGRFAAVLARLGDGLDRGEQLVARAAAGPDVSDAAVLIALQVGVYRYTETVELASKVVEGVSGAIRTTMQAG